MEKPIIYQVSMDFQRQKVRVQQLSFFFLKVLFNYHRGNPPVVLTKDVLVCRTKQQDIYIQYPGWTYISVCDYTTNLRIHLLFHHILASEKVKSKGAA